MRYFGFVFLLVLKSQAAIIDFEHSIVFGEGSLWGTEGSLWGTEDSLTAQLNISDEELPPSFKVKSQPHWVDVATRPSSMISAKYFAFGKARFFNPLRLCYSADSGLASSALTVALDHFRWTLLGPLARPDLFKITERVVTDSDSLESCDLFFQKGNWDYFPYSKFTALRKTDAVFWKNQIYAIFYQKDLNTIPVITLHPDVDIFYDESGKYVQQVLGKTVIDGRSLLLHEVGHAMGFKHMPADAGYSRELEELQVMSSSEKDPAIIDMSLRFVKSHRLWESWNMTHLLTYRQLLWKQRPMESWRFPVCFQVGEELSVSSSVEDLIGSVSYSKIFRTGEDLQFVATKEFGWPVLKNTYFSPFQNLIYTHDLPDNSLQFLGVEIQYMSTQWRSIFKFKALSPSPIFHIFAGRVVDNTPGGRMYSFGPWARRFKIVADPSECVSP